MFAQQRGRARLPDLSLAVNHDLFLVMPQRSHAEVCCVYEAVQLDLD
jgi:hypothetical protein